VGLIEIIVKNEGCNDIGKM